MHRNLYDERHRLVRVLARIRAAAEVDTHPLDVTWTQLPGEPVPFAEAVARAYEPGAVGMPWGPPWGTTWFRLTGDVPERMRGRSAELVVDLGFSGGGPGFQAEGLAHRADGSIIKGVEPRTTYVPLDGDGRVGVYVEAASNPTLRGTTPTSLGERSTAGSAPLYRLNRADLVVIDDEARALSIDVEVLLDLAHRLTEGDPRREQILVGLVRMADRLDLDDVPAEATAARAAIAPLLAAPANPSAHRVSLVGHAHIDSAWLWPVRETIRKCARTFSNVVALAETRPELRFACSSAQQYAWMKEHYPELWQRIRAAVTAGTFVPAGGMWVEADTNLPGGEAMARQLVHGARFLRDELGVECRDVWLPDSFGYTASLPQLARLAGARWFLSQKMSWNQTDDFPHHTFWWEGIDGTRVFTHFPPGDTYSAEVTAEELLRGQRGFRESGAATRSLLPFGYGDGGGGPTREMLDRAARFADLEGLPRVAVETPAEFFAAAEEEYAADAPVWSGEMYLEFHRGVYTSQVAMKQGNRRTEHLLREAELWATTAAVRAAAAYPYDELDRIWRAALLNQFHDILPGSSIAWVHREARTVYADLASSLEGIIGSAVSALGGTGDVAFNAAPFEVDGVPALSAGPVVAASGEVSLERSDDGIVIDNGVLQLRLDAAGVLVSVLDLRAGREVLAGPANLLQLHPDHPTQFDAWDIEPHYRARCTDLVAADSVLASVADDGAAEVLVVRREGPSTFEQRLRLAPGAGRVELETTVDWQHRETLLKAAFPLAVHADRSTSEIGFGHVHRPTHTNTSWDAARFEICAHRWLHVGEPGYGVALVNATTYGHDVTRAGSGDRRGPSPTTARMSLVRAPNFPDPGTDRGTHTFRYALVPGADIADAVREGYRINLPLRPAPGADVAPLVVVESGAAVVEAVKLAEDRSGDVVVRLYESLGGRTSARLRLGLDHASVEVVDLHERSDAEVAALAPLTVDGDVVTLDLGPFQVVTLRVGRRHGG
ncbi:glycoside hydrolase family 38 C-terminal domain-containing protein [Nocardioides sp. YIM 152315]|uniref:alpha-mannosidase n=1 Tax=Nocardioides sp. YIM 152315 TaxID=3031760 RepID=UPI0023D9BD74|nr:glycoside hydrolase family 38 C-terminal domain-containing protein [Nocardioides sp. YIM 152315]MDF1605783.1 glycoside hydrolase family 38 C-terminal domain-containing protein [Nocardioides sp. YIM 152315]